MVCFMDYPVELYLPSLHLMIYCSYWDAKLSLETDVQYEKDSFTFNCQCECTLAWAKHFQTQVLFALRLEEPS